MVSPASSVESASSPSSPLQGPFTPINPDVYASAQHNFKDFHATGIPNESAKYGLIEHGPMEFPSSYDLSDWGSDSLWPTDMDFSVFDFSSIPPLTLEHGYPEVDGLPESPVDCNANPFDYPPDSPVDHVAPPSGYDFQGNPHDAFLGFGPCDNLYPPPPEMMSEQCF